MDTDNFERMSFDECAITAKLNATAAGVRDTGDGTVLLLRPFQTYNMASAILMKGGMETGFTAHGHHDFMLTDDVIHKVHIGHYTFYHKSIVKQPKNVILAEDIFAQSYVSGEGNGVFPSNGDDTFADQISNDTFIHDIIPLWIPSGVHEDIQNPLDITGSYSNDVLNTSNTTITDNKLHYPHADKYSTALGFDRLQNYGSDEQFLSPIRHLNTICFQGHQMAYDAKKEGFTKITMNTGHWGPNVYPGCRSVRNGENCFLKDMEYEKYRVGGQLS